MTFVEAVKCPLLQTQYLDWRGNSALHFHTSQCEYTFVHVYTQNIKHASWNTPLELSLLGPVNSVLAFYF